MIPSARSLCLSTALSSALTAAAAVPGAVPGRYLDDLGRALAVEASGEALRVRLGEGSSSDAGTAVWSGTALVVTWSHPPARGLADAGAGAPENAADETAAFAAGSERGRLTLSHGRRVFRKEGASPWWRLSEGAREALRPRLSSTEGRAWVQHGYRPWHAARYGGTPVQEPVSLAEWTFDGLERGQRASLLALWAKMAREGVWELIGPLVHIGRSGELDFYPAVYESELRGRLSSLGYADAYGASSGSDWGVRSPRGGAQLHFRGRGKVNAHLDFSNPTNPREVPRHIVDDLHRWAEEHTPERVVSEIRAQGIAVEDSPDAP